MPLELNLMSRELVENTWGYLIDTYGEFAIVTIGTFIFHELVYFGWYLPYLIIDTVPFLKEKFKKYKIQPEKENTWPIQWNCLKRLIISHTLFQLPMMIMFHFMAPLVGIKVGKEGIPSMFKVCLITLFSFFIEDFYFYWVHRWLHWKVWYKYIHKIHHDHSAPFGMTAEYAHPVETMILGFGTILGPLLFADHIIVVYFYLFWRLFQTIEHHCGYEFPISPSNWFPFWSGAEFHDYHHETFTGNYSSSFIIWDYVFGTDRKYRERRALKLKSNGTSKMKSN